VTTAVRAAAPSSAVHEPPEGRIRPLWAGPASMGAAALVVIALLSFAQLNVRPFTNAPTAGLALLALALLLLRPVALLRLLLRADPLLVAFVALAPLSSIWSVNSDLTMERSRVLIGTTVVGVYIAARFDLRRQLRLLILALAIAGVLSAILLVVAPEQATAEDVRGDAWQGAFLTKNVFGRGMSLGAIAAAFMLCFGRPSRRWPYVCSTVLCTLLVIVSWSKAALAVTAVGLLVLALVGAARAIGDRPELVGVLVFAGAVGVLGTTAWFVIDPAAVLGALGRDATLTGRTGLWQLAVEAARERSFGGYGYGAFWQELRGPSRDIWLALPWGPPHAHNGLLEITLNVGLVGAALWLASLVVTVRSALLLWRRDASMEALWAWTLLAFIAVYNLTEVTGPQNHMFWTIYVATSFSLVRARREQDPRVRHHGHTTWDGAKSALPVDVTDLTLRGQ
jgi:exopolysaccharide production protein ExoQ